MKDNVSKYKIGEPSFWRDTKELMFVLWIGLQSNANCKKEFNSEIERSELTSYYLIINLYPSILALSTRGFSRTCHLHLV